MLTASSLLGLLNGLGRRLGDGEDVVDAADDEHAVADGGRRHQDFAHRVYREQLVLRPRLDDEDLSVLARKVELAVGGDGRGGERAAAVGEALLVDALAGRRPVGGQHPVVRERVEQVAVDDRRRHVRAAARLAPRDELARLLAVLQRDVPDRAGADGVDGLDGAVAARDVDEVVREDGSRRRYLGVGGEPPKLFARHGVVPAYGLRPVGYYLGARLPLVDRRRAPSGQLALAHRLPHLLARLQVVGGDERTLLYVGLYDDEVLVDDGRAAVLPLIIRVVEPAGVEHAEVLLPEELARQVVVVETFGAEEHEEVLAVGRGGRGGVRRLRVALDL